MEPMPIKTPSKPTQNQNPPKIKTHLATPISTHNLATTHTPQNEIHAKRPKKLQWQVLNERERCKKGNEDSDTKRDRVGEEEKVKKGERIK